MRGVLLLMVLLCGGWYEGQAQPSWLQRWDEAVLRDVYRLDTPLMRGLMYGAAYSAYPVFVSAAPLAGYQAWRTGSITCRRLTGALIGAQMTAFVTEQALKHLFRRKRPYLVLEDISSRDPIGFPEKGPYGFPSGHAIMAFTVATVISLSFPTARVYGPAFAWAGMVALSRVWLGVHYPSDVLVGAVIGVGIGTLAVYLARRWMNG